MLGPRRPAARQSRAVQTAPLETGFLRRSRTTPTLPMAFLALAPIVVCLCGVSYTAHWSTHYSLYAARNAGLEPSPPELPWFAGCLFFSLFAVGGSAFAASVALLTASLPERLGFRLTILSAVLYSLTFALPVSVFEFRLLSMTDQLPDPSHDLVAPSLRRLSWASLFAAATTGLGFAWLLYLEAAVAYVQAAVERTANEWVRLHGVPCSFGSSPPRMLRLQLAREMAGGPLSPPRRAA